MTVGDRVAALDELAPEEFIAARDHLAKELQDGGDRDGAADVRKLKRPSMAAWVLNQLVRRHGSEVEELISAGQQLREAQRAALEGGDRSALREAGAARRTLTDRLMDLSRDILTEAGHAASRTHLDRVERTLQAATLSEEAAAEKVYRVEFAKTRRVIECPEGTTVLEAARRAGMRLPSSCTKGVCGTCKSKLISGTVDMKPAGGIRPREIEAGMRLLCCSKPMSDLVVDR